MNIQAALAEWRSLLGEESVQDAAGAQERFGANTIGSQRRLLGALHPQDTAQIPAIVKIANRRGIPLYTIATGHNWGYGSALPTADDCVILDLGWLNRIVEFDAQLGYVTVEPGVTQQQLHDYIVDHQLEFMVPTTGAGPSCSILGNAIEKGYGITPHEDHFGAILSLKAVLADGSIYQSTLHAMGAYEADKIFKWKLGPAVEGLFAQGNLGIVTQVTLALARKPENVTQFLAFIDEEHFEDAVIAVARIKQQLGALVGGVNLMNKRRLLSMVEVGNVWKLHDTMTETQVRALASKRQLPDWAMLGGIYGPNELVAGARAHIKGQLTPFAKQVLFFSRRRLNFLRKLVGVLPLSRIRDTVESMHQGLSLLEGVPSRVALPLAYLKNPVRPLKTSNLEPDRDHCGLIWFTPLLPIEPALTRDFTQEVSRICLATGIDPLITLTAISERCFDSTIPILYDGNSESEKDKARRCYDALITLAREFGAFPYRLDIDAMRTYFNGAQSTSLQMLQKIKQALDPNGILAPGRYEKLSNY
jgi:4-cresol dehydrogenase (hydroxylating)